MLNEQLEGSVEGERDSSIDDRRVVPLLNFGVEELISKFLELSFLACKRVVSGSVRTVLDGRTRPTTILVAERERRVVHFDVRSMVTVLASLEE